MNCKTLYRGDFSLFRLRKLSPFLIRLIARELFELRDEVSIRSFDWVPLFTKDCNRLCEVIAKIGSDYCLDGLVIIKHFSDNSVSVRFYREFSRHPYYDRLPF